MSIDVVFRGPILFLKQEAVATQALIPDGERVLIDDFGTRGNHPDGEVATPHFAGIAIFEGEDEVFRADLRQRVIHLIAEDGQVACKTTPDLLDLVPIDTAANSGDRAPMTLINRHAHDYWSRVTGRVEFLGGTLSASQLSNATFVVEGVPRLQTPVKIPLSAAWSTTSDVATVQLSSMDGTNVERIRVKQGQVVFIYNWDERTPTPEALLEVPECTDGGQPNTDTDFKWLYELYDPPAANFTAWLGGKRLPAPETSCVQTTGAAAGSPGVPSPGSSGCVSGIGSGP